MQTSQPEPLTISVVEAGLKLSLSRNSAYRAAKRGEIPTIRVGKKLRVPVAKLYAMLGVPTDVKRVAA